MPTGARRRTFQTLQLKALGAFVVAFSIAACAGDLPVDPAGRQVRGAPIDVPANPQPSHQPDVPHVVVISIDGLRPDAVAAARAATLQRLIREGAASLSAQTVIPSITLPSHVSMLTGVVPARHGISWNNDRTAETGPVGVTTVFDEVHKAGYTSALFVGKSKLRHLLRPETPMRTSLPRGDEVWRAEQVSQQVVEYLRGGRPDLMFVHLPDADLAGHAEGWMSSEYLAAVRRTDDAVALIWAALRQAYGDDFTLIVTADHGGSGRFHHETSPDNSQIPWIVWGAGVRPQTLGPGIRTVDTAATVLSILRLTSPAGWDGKAVTSAFEAPTR